GRVPGARQLEPERAPGALLALESDLAAMRVRDLPAERETEAGAADRTRVGGVHAEEPLEDLSLLRGGNSEPGVADADAGGAVAGRRADAAAPAGRGVLDGVREQIRDDLPDAVAVAHDRQRFLGQLQRQLV